MELQAEFDAMDQALAGLEQQLAGIPSKPVAVAAVDNALTAVKQAERTIHHGINKFAKSVPAPQAVQPLLPASSNANDYLRVAILRHLLFTGHADVVSELGCVDPLEHEFRELNAVLASLDSEDYQPALQWALQHQDLLRNLGSSLEFDIHASNFIKLVKRGGSREEAVWYARTNLSQYGSMPMYANRLPGILFALIDPQHIELPQVKQEFQWCFCCSIGVSTKPPLEIAAYAGSFAVPALAKMHSIMKNRNAGWSSTGELPVEIDLPPDLVFHPIFVCPVSKEQTDSTNPPSLLPCGHIISRESVKSLLQASHAKSSFKCPYCPQNTNVERIETVHF